MTKPLVVYIGSLLLLLLTAIASARAGREVDVSNFPMDQVPARIGVWQWEQRKTADASPGKANAPSEVHSQHRVYRATGDDVIGVNLKVTSSRIGALRDYATALVADGWTPGEITIWETTPPGTDFAIKTHYQVLHKGPGRMYTLNWYISPRRQAISFQEAVFAGWLAKMSGNPLWGQVYLTMACKEENPKAKQQLLDFADELLPMFRTVLLQYADRRLSSSQPTGERN